MTPTQRARQSSEQRLAGLDRVFSVDQFQDGQALSAKAASVYLARWQAQGLIARLGPRCGLWVNFLKPGGTSITWRDRVEGLLRKHPHALVGGHSALAAWEWAPARTGMGVRVLIPQGYSRAKIDGFDLQVRPPRAHAALRSLAQPHPELGLPTLPGPAVVADHIAQGQDVPLALRQRAGDIAPLVQRLGGTDQAGGGKKS